MPASLTSPTIGHAAERAWLDHAIASGRLSGSYLFLGPPGVGKRRIALEFASALRCKQRVSGWACMRCNECTRVAGGVHPSVRVFEKPEDLRDLPVELVRDICEQASLTRLEPGQRIFIIDDADRFNENSANAFLKTLEEPPPELTFVLLAGNAAQMLPTIISRCQTVRFSPLTAPELEQVTRNWPTLAEYEGSRELLLRAAQGSAGRLQRLIDSGALELAQNLLDGLKADPFKAAEQLASALSKGLPADAATEAGRERLRDVLGILAGLIRDHMAARPEFEGAAPLLRAGRGSLDIDDFMTALNRIEELRERVDGNANLKLVCDALALALPA